MIESRIRIDYQSKQQASEIVSPTLPWLQENFKTANGLKIEIQSKLNEIVGTILGSRVNINKK